MAAWVAQLATALSANMLVGVAVSIGAAALIDSETVVDAISKVGDAAEAVGEAAGRTIGSATKGLADGLGITTPLMIAAGVFGAVWVVNALSNDDESSHDNTAYDDSNVDYIDAEYEVIDNDQQEGDDFYAVQ